MAWQEVLPGSNAWFHEYDFYQAKHNYTYQANALALLLNDHDLAIVSPPCGASEEDFAAIDGKGRVTALIASCGGHDAGQSQWQARYPDAVPYAPTNALERLETFQRPFVPLSQLSAPRVEFQETPGANSGEAIAITQGKRPVVFLGELLLTGTRCPPRGSSSGLQDARPDFESILCIRNASVRIVRRWLGRSSMRCKVTRRLSWRMDRRWFAQVTWRGCAPYWSRWRLVPGRWSAGVDCVSVLLFCCFVSPSCRLP